MPNDTKPITVTDDIVAPSITPVATTTPPEPSSVAPANDIVMPMQTQEISSTPRKKFAGGKIIATILGLFLLVGGTGAGIYLVGQNQNLEEQAAGNTGNKCFDDCRKESGTKVCNQECNTNYVPGVPDAGNTNPDGSCSIPCGGPGLTFNFCLPAGSTKTCNEEAASRGYVVPVGDVQCQFDGNYWSSTLPDTNPDKSLADSTCDRNKGNFGTGAYLCPKSHSGPCTESNGKPFTGNLACFCGVVQKDTGNGHTTYMGDCGCGGNDEPEPTPNPTPTPPAITASCQNLKAYSTTGNTEVPLTGQQLSALRPGSQFNLCVQGIKTGGSFDKVRFTINGALQAEQAMTDRIGTTTEGKFCTLYTIPQTLPAGGVFTFRAEMHHVTLGWK